MCLQHRHVLPLKPRLLLRRDLRGGLGGTHAGPHASPGAAAHPQRPAHPPQLTIVLIFRLLLAARTMAHGGVASWCLKVTYTEPVVALAAYSCARAARKSSLDKRIPKGTTVRGMEADGDPHVPPTHRGIAKVFLSIAFPAILSEGLEFTATMFSLRCVSVPGAAWGVVATVLTPASPAPLPGSWAATPTASTLVGLALRSRG